jgi:mRNA interferase MazF
MKMSGKNYLQFDVWLIDLDPTKGSEVQKSRPCVIVSPNGMNNNLNTVIIAPLSHSNKNYPSRIPSLFKKDPVQIMLDQIRCVDKLRLTKKMGSIDNNTSSDVLKLLRTMFS